MSTVKKYRTLPDRIFMATIWLFLVFLMITFIQFFIYCILDFNEFNEIPKGKRIIVLLCQSISIRTGGIQILQLDRFSSGSHIVMMICMYLSSYPVTITCTIKHWTIL